MSQKKVVNMTDEGLFGNNKKEKKDVVMQNSNDANTKNDEEKTEKTSADYYFDSYSHFGMLL